MLLFMIIYATQFFCLLLCNIFLSDFMSSALRALARSAQRNAFVHASRTNYRGMLLRNAYALMTTMQQHHRLFSSTSILTNSSTSRNGVPVQSASDAQAAETSSSEPRMAIAFTCTVAECGERSAHHFTKRSYERGIVLVQCPKCKNRSVFIPPLERILR